MQQIPEPVSVRQLWDEQHAGEARRLRRWPEQPYDRQHGRQVCDDWNYAGEVADHIEFTFPDFSNFTRRIYDWATDPGSGLGDA